MRDQTFFFVGGLIFPKSPKVNFCVINSKMMVTYFKDIDEIYFSSLYQSFKTYITSYFTKITDDKIKLK